MGSPRFIFFGLSTLVALFLLYRFTSTSYVSQSHTGFEHPIPQLMTEAEVKYNTLLNKQSKSLEDTVAEYKRRYHMDPPKGFEDWYAFAVQNNVKIIDEYDGLMEDLEPFRDMSGEELRRRVAQVCSCQRKL